MAEINFPRRREDGSFIVFARFSTLDLAIVELVQDFLKAWMRANNPWIRVWRSDTIWEERLDFDSEFLSEPRVDCEPGGLHFSVVLEGRPSSTRWKDWAVLMVGDISTVFPEVKFERFDSK